MRETGRATSRGLNLLGGWQLVVDGDVVALGGREQRLCALLALTGTRGRAQVAGMLWPESTDARALASLRRAVAQTHERCPGLLSADRTSVGLAADVVVDVDDLRSAVSAVGSADAVPDRSLLDGLAGEQLLPGWYDEWVEVQRDDLERQRVGALERLARHALDQGDAALAEDAARAVARIEPLRESTSELLIRAFLTRGDRAGAVRELARYREVVRTELGVVPSPSLVSLVETAAPVVVPVQRRAPVTKADRPAEPAEPAEPTELVLRADTRRPRRAARPTPPPGPPPGPPPPPDPLSPPGPAGLSRRATAVRLAVGAALVVAASVSVANLGPDRAPPSAPASAGDRLPDATAAPPTGQTDQGAAARQVLVRPVGSTEGAAVFVVRATQRPARVRLEVAGPSGRSLVRSVVVRSRDGQRLVLGGLDGGTYEWSATSPTAAPVVGEVRVQEADAPALAAAAAPQRDPSPPPAPSPTPTPTTSSPTATPTPTPTPTPTSTPSTTPVQQTQQPSPSPSPSPSQTPQPSPTRHPSPPGEPTDPGTQDPGPVG